MVGGSVMENLKCVRNFNDANKLIELGHKLVRIDRDKRDRSFMVFLFEANESIIRDLKSLEK